MLILEIKTELKKQATYIEDGKGTNDIDIDNSDYKLGVIYDAIICFVIIIVIIWIQYIIRIHY